jgi:hypothetical protein
MGQINQQNQWVTNFVKPTISNIAGGAAMKTVLKKQIDDMSEDELKEVLRREYMRKLTRYRITDDFYRNKYGMDLERFEKENIVEKQNYSFEVESDSQEWEIAIDGIKTIEKKMKELIGEN